MTSETKSWASSYLGYGLSRRRLLKGAAAGTGAALLIACGGGGSDTLKLDDAGTSRQPGTVWFAKNNWRLADETKEAVRGGVYRGHMAVDLPGHFDPITQGPATSPFSAHTHESLMFQNRGPGIDPSSTEGSRPRGAMAEAWEISSDGLTITFTMRQGVKFHPIAPVNGRVMDIDDWRTTHERHLSSGMYRSAMVDIIEKTAFPDARHMVWTLKAPFAPISESIWSTMFGYNMMPKELNANPGLAETLAIGTGYKIIDKYQPAIGFEYRKNPAYWAGDPFIERWNAPIIPEYSNQYAQFISGNITDFSPTAKDVLLLHKDAPSTVIVANEIPDNSATRIRFGRVSPEKWPWADPRVRIAMQRSIDYKTIGVFLSNQQQFEAAGIPVELTPMTHLPQHRGYWLNPEKGELGALSLNYLYDPAEAKKLTAAAGHTGPVEIPIFVLPVAGAVPEADQLVMDSMERSGAIKLDVHRALSRQEHDKYRLEGQYDGIIPQGGSSQDADYFITRDYHSKGRLGTAGLTNQAYPDPRIDAIGDAQRKEMDIEKRFQLLKDFQHLAAELMPAVAGRHLSTEFSFRWPWLHNSNYGAGGSPPGGREVWGGHLHWLDSSMPNRGSS